MKNFYLLLFFFVSALLSAQPVTPDTVVVELAKSSKVVFTMQDPSDIEELRQYDFQALFDDIFSHYDTIAPDQYKYSSEAEDDTLMDDQDDESEYGDNENEDDDEDDDAHRHHWFNAEWNHDHPHHTGHFFNLDFGINNYLQENGFPDEEGAPYAVRPWGSWYVGINSILRTHVAPKFYVEWGVGVSWYNFKFQDDRTLLTREENSVLFAQDPRNLDFVKSKLSVAYINASVIPMLSFGHERDHHRLWNWHDHSFRIGLGPYVGYRIESHTKQVYEDGNDKESDKERDSYYLNNLRYGLRLQLGIRATDFFIQYDLNQLFTEGKGPELHPISFGIVF